MGNIKFAGIEPGTSGLEVTALPTEPQPLSLARHNI